jgi:dehydrogenase/reductase SDR family member 7B
MDFTNKKIWITGASSGIGESLAYEFSKLGAEIIISSRRADELERVKNNCQNKDKTFIQILDLAKHDEIASIAGQVLNRFGKIDILVNNGGISQRSLCKETPLEIDKKIMDINYFGTVCLTKAILPSMLERKEGYIVVISSLTGKFGAPLRSAYAASKHALHGFFDSLRIESSKDGLKITLVCPGYIRTNVSINALTASGKPQNSMDPDSDNGMPPEKLAKKIIKAIDHGQEEIVIGGKEIMGVYLKRFLPRLFSNMMKMKKDS